MNPPLIILGAARSGTKILRSILACHTRLAAVPYDINYVWRFGNDDHPDDELHPEQLSEAKIAFIRTFIDRFRASDPEVFVVEKTVSNTLRVPFVDKVFPDARYIHLYRDGRAVAASARLQWGRRSSMGSLLAKVKTFPLRHAHGYATRYLRQYSRQLLSKQKTARSWGPRIIGMDDLVAQKELIEVCALQWRRCVTRARHDLQSIPAARRIDVSYEQLVADPKTVIGNILEKFGLPVEAGPLEYAERNLTSANLGKWRLQLSAREARLLEDLLAECLDSLGYLDTSGPKHVGGMARAQERG